MKRQRLTPMPYRFTMRTPPEPFHRDLPGTPSDRSDSPPDCEACPVCKRALPVLSLAGRPRIYCTNACRQWAYRWRRQHRVRLIADCRHRAESGRNTRRLHALRDDRDPVANVADDAGRQVSVCGTYIRPTSNHPTFNSEFVPEASPDACRQCTRLVGMPEPDSLEAIGHMLERSANLPWLPDQLKSGYQQLLDDYQRLRPALEADPQLAARYISERTTFAVSSRSVGPGGRGAR